MHEAMEGVAHFLECVRAELLRRADYTMEWHGYNAEMAAEYEAEMTAQYDTDLRAMEKRYDFSDED